MRKKKGECFKPIAPYMIRYNGSQKLCPSPKAQ